MNKLKVITSTPVVSSELNGPNWLTNLSSQHSRSHFRCDNPRLMLKGSDCFHNLLWCSGAFLDFTAQCIFFNSDEGYISQRVRFTLSQTYRLITFHTSYCCRRPDGPKSKGFLDMHRQNIAPLVFLYF